MRHLHEEILAGVALGDDDRPRLRERGHLLACRHCAGRLAELRTIVATGREAPPYALLPPRAGLLGAIQAELATDDEPGRAQDRVKDLASEPSGVVRPRTAATQPAHARTPHPGRWLAAAAALVVLAVSGTVAYRNLSDDVVSTAVLNPLPAKSGSGTAELVRRRSGPELSVSVSTPPPANAFEQLWLINTDGRRMISIGIVPADGQGSYTVPAANGALAGYTIVDISLEPFDGNAAHSHNSVLRGTLG